MPVDPIVKLRSSLGNHWQTPLRVKETQLGGVELVAVYRLVVNGYFCAFTSTWDNTFRTALTAMRSFIVQQSWTALWPGFPNDWLDFGDETVGQMRCEYDPGSNSFGPWQDDFWRPRQVPNHQWDFAGWYSRRVISDQYTEVSRIYKLIIRSQGGVIPPLPARYCSFEYYGHTPGVYLFTDSDIEWRSNCLMHGPVTQYELNPPEIEATYTAPFGPSADYVAAHGKIAAWKWDGRPPGLQVYYPETLSPCCQW